MWIRVENPKSDRSNFPTEKKKVLKTKKKKKGKCKKCHQVIEKTNIRVQVHKVMDNRFYHIECYRNEDPPEKIKIEEYLKDSEIVKKFQKQWEEEFTEKYSKKKRKIETIYSLVEKVKKRKLDLESDEFFFDIPNEIWILILSFLPFREIVHQFSMSNKSCLEITYEDNLWRELNLTHFGEKFLIENEEEFSHDNFKLFIKLHHEICSKCKLPGDSKTDYFGPTDSIICSNCRESSEFEVLTPAAAKSKFKVSEDDLKKLKFHKEWNPNNKQVPKILYLKADVENLMFESRKCELISELKRLKVDIEKVDFSQFSMAHDFIHKVIKNQVKFVAKSIKASMPKE